MQFTPSRRKLSIGETDAIFVREDFGDHIELNQILNESTIIHRLMGEVRPEDVFLDVGSNLGVYSVFVGKQLGSGNVVSVEPIESTAEKLVENLEMNGIDAEVANVAFADADGTITLDVPDSHGSTSVSSEGVEVRSVRGDVYMAERSLPVPTVVKIDVEGYELAVLSGLKSTLAKASCRLLYCEVHPDLLPRFDASAEAVHQLLESTGFEVERLAELPGGRYVLRAAKERSAD